MTTVEIIDVNAVRIAAIRSTLQGLRDAVAGMDSMISRAELLGLVESKLALLEGNDG
jgi:hypothetical protein